MKVIRNNNNYYRLLKGGKKKRIKRKLYLKYTEYDSDGDYNMNVISYEPIELTGDKPKSILKTTKKETRTGIWSDKQVRFNDDNNDTRIYHLTPEEKMDKSLHYQAIQQKRKYYY